MESDCHHAELCRNRGTAFGHKSIVAGSPTTGTMRELDQTDVRILQLLAEDARRPYSDIGETVDLSAPAVSDRITRLREAGIIRQFTVDIDRSQLRAGVPVLVRLELHPDALETVRTTLREDEAVEHLFTTAAGDLVFHARAPRDRVHEWLTGTIDTELVREVDVELLSAVEWAPSVEGAEFAPECAECGNPVSDNGQSARFDETVYHFCCPTCESRFTERYERMDEAA